MPIGAYFKGRGDTVMRNMKKKYGAKKGTQTFYATANARGMTPRSHLPKGASLSPKGDLGKLRQAENARVGGFTDGADVCASAML